MLSMTEPPLSVPVENAPEEPAITSEVPACEEDEVARAAEASKPDPEGRSSETAPKDEGAENLPCQVDFRTVRSKPVLLNEGEAECECSSPHSLEPQPRSWPWGGRAPAREEGEQAPSHSE